MREGLVTTRNRGPREIFSMSTIVWGNRFSQHKIWFSCVILSFIKILHNCLENTLWDQVFKPVRWSGGDAGKCHFIIKLLIAFLEAIMGVGVEDWVHCAAHGCLLFIWIEVAKHKAQRQNAAARQSDTFSFLGEVRKLGRQIGRYVPSCAAAKPVMNDFGVCSLTADLAGKQSNTLSAVQNWIVDGNVFIVLACFIEMKGACASAKDLV